VLITSRTWRAQPFKFQKKNSSLHLILAYHPGLEPPEVSTISFSEFTASMKHQRVEVSKIASGTIQNPRVEVPCSRFRYFQGAWELAARASKAPFPLVAFFRPQESAVQIRKEALAWSTQSVSMFWPCDKKCVRLEARLSRRMGEIGTAKVRRNQTDSPQKEQAGKNIGLARIRGGATRRPTKTSEGRIHWEAPVCPGSFCPGAMFRDF